MAMGEILGALLGKAIKTGVQGYNKAGQLRDYSRALNYGMPADQQVPQFGNRFFFGDSEQYAKGLDAAQTNRAAQAEAQYYADRAGLPVGPRDAVKQVYTGEFVPQKNKQVELKLTADQQKEQGRNAMMYRMFMDRYGDANPQQMPAMPNAGPQTMPAMPNQGPMPMLPKDRNMGSGVMMEYDPMVQGQQSQPMQGAPLQGGIAQRGEVPMPELPEWLSARPEDVNAYYNNQTSMRGQNITARGQDLTYQTNQQRLANDKRRTDAYINNLSARTGIAREQLKQGWARISKMTGRAPSKVELAQDMLKRGEINQTEFKKFVLAGGKEDQPVNIFGDNANIDMGDDGGGGDVDAQVDAYLNGQ